AYTVSQSSGRSGRNSTKSPRRVGCNSKGIQSPSMIARPLALSAAIFALAAQAQRPREWRDYAGGPDSSKFVASTQITKENVSRLQAAWTYAEGQTDFNPLVVRGTVYGRGPRSSFVALDAATGRQLWIHEGPDGFN